MENRLSEILHKKDQFLNGDETLIYVKGNTVIARHNDGEVLSEITANLQEEKELIRFLQQTFGDHD